MGVASWSFDLVWAVGGSGPAGGLLPAESWVAGWCSGVLPVWWVLGWGWLPGAGIGDTSAWWWAAAAVVVVVVGWLVGAPLLGVACCRGSGAVRPGCLARFFCFSVCWRGGGGCGWVGCELYSGREHLTVSLRQVFCFVVCCVVCFYERSVDALASGADEGRGGLRYSSGSRLAGCDPRVSEWGDPARVMSCHLHLNCIGCGG